MVINNIKNKYKNYKFNNIKIYLINNIIIFQKALNPTI